MSSTVKDAMRQGADSAIETIQKVEKIGDDVSSVTLFAKLMKKADDAAQSAM